MEYIARLKAALLACAGEAVKVAALLGVTLEISREPKTKSLLLER